MATVFENLEAGLTVEEVMEEFSVTREQVNAVLHFAARSLKMPFRLRCMHPRPPMLILFDHGTPRSIAPLLHSHTVVEAIARGGVCRTTPARF